MAKRNKPLTSEQEQAICQDYADKVPLSTIAKKYGVSRAWVYSLLVYHQKKADRMQGSGRNVFTGIDFTRAVKKSLKEEAKRRKTSVSALVSKWVDERLKHDGIVLDEESVA